VKRKCLAVGIILLFVGTCIIPAIAQDAEKPLPTSKGNWLYVGGSEPGNYTRIQDAIDNASEGDTVFVYDDASPYCEQVIVEKSVKLIGENKNTTIIDGGGHGVVLNITVNQVTISGFTIEKGGNLPKKSGGILIYGNEINITGNFIINNTIGIWSVFTNYHIIAKNIFIANQVGIFLEDSCKNEVYENYFENNSWGIWVGSLTFPSKYREPLVYETYHNIYGNTILGSDAGIVICYASFTNVLKNNITDNYCGVSIYADFFVASNSNTITQNNINHNTQAVYVETDGGQIVANNISRNNIMYNQEGISINFGHNWLEFSKISHNIISYNNFIGNTRTTSFEYSLFNRWVGNYWEKERLLPYPIIGKIMILRHIIPWISFDWRPAQEPYDIFQ
jgi:parallel beta-helix repeat protein